MSDPDDPDDPDDGQPNDESDESDDPDTNNGGPSDESDVEATDGADPGRDPAPDDVPDSHVGSGTGSGPAGGPGSPVESGSTDAPGDDPEATGGDGGSRESAFREPRRSDADTAAGGPFQRPGDVDHEESRVLRYVVPFVAALLVAVGIAGVVLGGWGVVQPAVGACDTAVVSVSTPEQTEQRLANDAWASSVDRLAYEELTPAEQRAFAEALERPQREGTVDGDFRHRAAFERGVVVTHRGTDRYATVVSTNRCLAVDPLLLPLGAVTLLVGSGAFAYLWYRFGARPPDDWDIRFWGR